MDLPALRTFAATEAWQALTGNSNTMEKIRENKAYQSGRDFLAQRMHHEIWNESKFYTSRAEHSCHANGYSTDDDCPQPVLSRYIVWKHVQ